MSTDTVKEETLDEGFVDYFCELMKEDPDFERMCLADLMGGTFGKKLAECAYFHEVQACIFLKRHVDFNPKHIPQLEDAIRQRYDEEKLAEAILP